MRRARKEADPCGYHYGRIIAESIYSVPGKTNGESLREEMKARNARDFWTNPALASIQPVENEDADCADQLTASQTGRTFVFAWSWNVSLYLSLSYWRS